MKPTFADVLIAARKGSDREFYEILKAYGEPEAVGKDCGGFFNSIFRAGVVILMCTPFALLFLALYLEP